MFLTYSNQCKQRNKMKNLTDIHANTIVTHALRIHQKSEIPEEELLNFENRIKNGEDLKKVLCDIREIKCVNPQKNDSNIEQKRIEQDMLLMIHHAELINCIANFKN